jgi:hypothetical protein
MKHITRLMPVACLLGATAAMAAAPDAPLKLPFNERGELQRPADYREWVFLNSALGLTYGPNRSRPGEAPRFSNVFVNPAAYRAFQQTGQWPDGTFFLLEVRASEQPVAATAGSSTQASRVALEAAVRDSSRFGGEGWAYFSFSERGQLRDTTAPLARSASCYACHEAHGAVQWTFTQFYADAFEHARQLGTVRRDYDPQRKIGEPPH